MIISVASGKGGTGKTSVAVSIALSVPNINLIDSDVEEPNVHVLLNPVISSNEVQYKNIPKINLEACILCGECAGLCEFNAIAVTPKDIMLFEELCHSCGLCAYFCRQKAITEVYEEIGTIRCGNAESISIYFGELKIGEHSAVPLIKKLKSKIRNERLNIIDSPPGTSCSMVEAVRGSDFCLLVTEPTPFGLNDLKLAAATLKAVKIKFGVIINKDDRNYNRIDEYCKENDIPILLRIDYDLEIARAYSKGIPPAAAVPELQKDFAKVIEEIGMLLTKEISIDG